LPLDPIPRRLLGEEPRGDLADEVAVRERTQLARLGDLSNRRARELPTGADRLDTGHQAGRHHRDHPLLALRDHRLPRLEVLPQRHAIEVDVDAHAVARHLGERRGEAGRAAVLQGLDEAALDQLDARLDQLLARERVADLHGRALLVCAVAELLAREHAGAADAVAPGRRAVQDDDVPRPARARSGQPFGREEADAHRVDKTVVLVRRVEDGLAADGWDADAVAVRRDAGDGAGEAVVRRAEAQSVEQGNRPRAHRDDVAEDPADAGRGPLKRLDGRGMVVALDLERDRFALTEVDDAGVLAGSEEHARTPCGQPPEERRRVLVAAMLGPEQREDGELEVIRIATEQASDSSELPVGEPEGAMEQLFRYGRQVSDCRGPPGCRRPAGDAVRALPSTGVLRGCSLGRLRKERLRVSAGWRLASG
jgi:hypothetical protein